MKRLLVLILAASTLPALAKKKTIDINSALKPCTGLAPVQCMEYRDHHTAQWMLMHGGIEGFNYEPGYAYTLRIKERKLKNQPADASSIKRTLIKVISKEPVMSIALPHQPIQGKYLLQTIYTPTETVAPGSSKYVLEFDAAEGRLSGKICNSFSTSYQTGAGNVVKTGMIRSTKMMCPNMSHEDALFATLPLVNNYSFEDGKLLLKKDSETLIVLSVN